MWQKWGRLSGQAPTSWKSKHSIQLGSLIRSGCLKMCVFALYCVHQEVADHDGKVLWNIYPFKKKKQKNIQPSYRCDQGAFSESFCTTEIAGERGRLLMFQDNKDRVWRLKKSGIVSMPGFIWWSKGSCSQEKCDRNWQDKTVRGVACLSFS